MYIPTKQKLFRKKGYKIMYKGCERKSQLSKILTEPLNPRVWEKQRFHILIKHKDCKFIHKFYDLKSWTIKVRTYSIC